MDNVMLTIDCWRHILVVGDFNQEDWKALRRASKLLYRVCNEAQENLQRNIRIYLIIREHSMGHGERLAVAYRNREDIPATYAIPHLSTPLWRYTADDYSIINISLHEYFNFLRRRSEK
jgi:hypothetical protein